MLDSKSLRIGNWLKGKVYVQVDSIIDNERVGLASGGNPYYVAAKEPYKPCLDPIPLTKEILLKCGFEKDQIEIDNEFVYFCIDRSDIKHVHQLQNLYHSLTGKELEAKL